MDRPRLLVITHDEATSQVACTILLREGWDVVVTDAPEALARLASADYRAVVLDLDLPHGDASGFVRRYRAQGGALPIVLLARHAASSAITEALNLGADSTACKPMRSAELAAVMRAVLRRSGVRELESV